MDDRCSIFVHSFDLSALVAEDVTSSSSGFSPSRPSDIPWIESTKRAASAS